LFCLESRKVGAEDFFEPQEYLEEKKKKEKAF